MRFVELSHKKHFVNRYTVPDNPEISNKEFREKVIAALGESGPNILHILYYMTRGPTEATISFFRIPNELIEKLFVAEINQCTFGINPNNSNTHEIKVLDGIPEHVKIISAQISISA